MTGGLENLGAADLYLLWGLYYMRFFFFKKLKKEYIFFEPTIFYYTKILTILKEPLQLNNGYILRQNSKKKYIKYPNPRNSSKGAKF